MFYSDCPVLKEGFIEFSSFINFVPFNFVLNPNKAVPEVLRLGNESFLYLSSFDEHWLVSFTYCNGNTSASIISRRADWQAFEMKDYLVVEAEEQDSGDLISVLWSVTQILHDTSQLIALCPCSLAKLRYECFVSDFTFLQTEGQLCRLFFFCWLVW